MSLLDGFLLLTTFVLTIACVVLVIRLETGMAAASASSALSDISDTSSSPSNDKVYASLLRNYNVSFIETLSWNDATMKPSKDSCGKGAAAALTNDEWAPSARSGATHDKPWTNAASIQATNSKNKGQRSLFATRDEHWSIAFPMWNQLPGLFPSTLRDLVDLKLLGLDIGTVNESPKGATTYESSTVQGESGK